MNRRPGPSLLATLVACLIPVMFAWAEYADVILNDNSEAEGVAPVIFPHWFHRIRFRCKVCHHELGFEMRAGANDVTMVRISDGEFCGMCHDGETAWSAEKMVVSESNDQPSRLR